VGQRAIQLDRDDTAGAFAKPLGERAATGTDLHDGLGGTGRQRVDNATENTRV